METFSWAQLEILSKLYSNEGTVVVYLARHNNSQLVAVKKIYVQSVNEVSAIQQEAYSMTSVSHPNIITMLGSFVSDDSKGRVDSVALVMEYFTLGDLSKEVNKRGKTNDFWPEDELFRHMIELIGAHQHLESMGLAHRDIKPQNIFLSQDERGLIKLKVADLGLMYKKEDVQTFANRTIAGTPLYLSPILRAAYVNALMNGSNSTANHDIFKSDVYSLGFTFLQMATLQKLEQFSTLNNLQAMLNSKVNQIRYQTLKPILSLMLAVDERHRPNFTELLGWVQKNYNLMNNPQPQTEIHIQSPTPSNNLSSINPTGQPARRASSHSVKTNKQDELIKKIKADSFKYFAQSDVQQYIFSNHLQSRLSYKLYCRENTIEMQLNDNWSNLKSNLNQYKAADLDSLIKLTKILNYNLIVSERPSPPPVSIQQSTYHQPKLCSNCKKPAITSCECKHNYCEECQFLPLCVICYHELNIKPVGELSAWCSKCNMPIIYKARYFLKCENCQNNLCTLCKATKHDGSCIEM